MKIVNKALTDMDGEPLKSGDIAMTVANILMNVALAPPQSEDPTKPPKPLKPEESMTRYELARMLHGVALNESFDVPVEQVARLQKDMGFMYAPLVAGQVNSIIEGGRADEKAEPKKPN